MIFAMLSGVYFQNFGIIGFSMKLFNLNNHPKNKHRRTNKWFSFVSCTFVNALKNRNCKYNKSYEASLHFF